MYLALHLLMVLGAILASVGMARLYNRGPLVWGLLGGILALALPWRLLNYFVAILIVFVALAISNMIQRKSS